MDILKDIWKRMEFFQNNTTLNLVVQVQPSLLLQTINLLTTTYFILSAYVVPWEFLLGTANNLLCLLVFLFDRQFYDHTNRNARIYYIVLAVCDLGRLWIWFLIIFLGDGLSWITRGTYFVYWQSFL